MALLKVLAFDYAAAGGVMTRQLPQLLRRQGEMLLKALQSDLLVLPGVELTMMPVQRPGQQEDPTLFSERFEACMDTADAVWPLASESEGVLERISRDVVRARRILLGSAPGAVRVAASKLAMADRLSDSGVLVAATYSPHAALPDEPGAWVVKPDDGSGCFNIRLFSDRAAALAWIRSAAVEGYVLQPFLAGKQGSLSLLCCDGVARVLGCNLERVAMRNNRFHFLGSTVNGLTDHDGSLDRLAQQIAAAIPTLWGYVGVDFVLTDRGAVVLDVNPRLTAAYTGLRASIGHNPAGLVIDLLKGPAAMPAPLGALHAVNVDLGPDGST